MIFNKHFQAILEILYVSISIEDIRQHFENKFFNVSVLYLQLMMLIWEYECNMKHKVIFIQTILPLVLSRSLGKNDIAWNRPTNLLLVYNDLVYRFPWVLYFRMI